MVFSLKKKKEKKAARQYLELVLIFFTSLGRSGDGSPMMPSSDGTLGKLVVMIVRMCLELNLTWY